MSRARASTKKHHRLGVGGLHAPKNPQGRPQERLEASHQTLYFFPKEDKDPENDLRSLLSPRDHCKHL
jgi:hypothetical protein